LAARRGYPALILLMLAVGGGIGGMIGGVIADNKFEEQVKAQEKNQKVNRAKMDWDAFLFDLRTDVEKIKI
jgi:hypothetical protein